MPVLPGEVFVSETEFSVGVLLRDAMRQGVPVRSVRKVENGYMVPSNVRDGLRKQRDRPARRRKRANSKREVDF